MPKRFLQCKKPIIFSTFNARSLLLDKHVEELILCVKQQNIDLISIQDHRFYHPETELQYNTLDGYLVTSYAHKSMQGSRIGGIGILLSRKAIDNFVNIEKIFPRILVAEFEN